MMRHHPMAIAALTCLAACTGELVEQVDVTTSTPGAPEVSTVDTGEEPDSGEASEATSTTSPTPESTPPTPSAPPGPPEADAGEAFPDGVANNLILVQDFDSPIQLASYTTDGELAATYVADTGEIAWQPIWAPDGRSVAWASSENGGPWSLVVADVDGTSRSEYELPGRPDYLAFDPTSSSVVSLTPSPEGFGLVVVELDDPAWRLIDVGRPYFSDFSPDGERVVSHVADRLRIVGIDGSTEPIGIETIGHQTPAWHPDGDRLVITDDSADRTTIVTYDVTTGATREIAAFADFVMFDVDPTGRRLAVVSFEIDRDGSDDADDREPAVEALRSAPADVRASGVWTVDLDTLDAVLLSADSSVAPMFDPTGELVLTRDAASGIGTWTVRTVDGEAVTSVERDINSSLLPNYLPFWDQFGRTLTLWSPDGDQFVHVGSDTDGDAGVWIHDLATGASRLITDGELAFWSPT